MTMVYGFAAPLSAWIWLFPATLLVHLVEEYVGGVAFADSPRGMRGINISRPLFVILTGAGLLLVVAGVAAAQRFGFSQLMLAILGIFVLINGISHTITTTLKAEYNPGVISGLLLWIPLGAMTLVRVKGNMDGQRFWTGIALGIISHAVVSLLARGKRKPGAA
ncbi:MAG: HXXEE domain-containing protein [Pyrinomonadaceae bacterium]